MTGLIRPAPRHIMAITYTNRKGRKYFLCYQVSEKGQRQYCLSRKIIGQPADTLPDGYQIHESEDGQVRLIKEKKPTVTTIKKDKQPLQQRKTDSPGSRTCPVCGQLFSFSHLKWHVRDNHPFYTPRDAIAASVLNDPRRKQPVKRPLPRRHSTVSGQVRRNNNAPLEVEQVECGWCYETIYRAWQPNGFYRYYDDAELTRKHRCTRPAGWDPDH